MNKIRVIGIAAAATLLAAGVATPAAADHIADPVWTMPVQLTGPGQVSGVEATARVKNCRTVEVTEHRTDRATRYHRVNGDFPPPSQGAFYPKNQQVRTLIPVTPGQRQMVYSWTTATPGLDLAGAVIVPSCADDFDPRT